MIKRMLKLISAWTWEIMQTLLGLFMLVWYAIRDKIVKGETEHHAGRVIISIESEIMPGVSLGYFIFLNVDHVRNWNKTVRHEYGHCIQSMIFGPLYLIVIGLPSVRNNIMARYDIRIAKTYYQRYPENWADRLGGIER